MSAASSICRSPPAPRRRRAAPAPPRAGSRPWRRASAGFRGRAAQHLRAHEVVGEIGVQDAVGGQRAGTLGEHHARDAELVGHGDRVQARRAAERDHDEVARIEALLEQREADRCAQAGIGDGEQPLGAPPPRQARAGRRRGRDGGPGRGRVEPHAAAEEALAIEPAEHHVGVGDRRPRAAVAVAGGTRPRAGARRPDGQSPAAAAPWRSSRRPHRWCGSPPSAGAPASDRSRPA